MSDECCCVAHRLSWLLIPREKKQLTARYIQGIVAATPSKAGGGHGSSTAKFSLISHMKIDRPEIRQGTGSKWLWKYYAGFDTHCRNEIWMDVGSFQARVGPPRSHPAREPQEEVPPPTA